MKTIKGKHFPSYLLLVYLLLIKKKQKGEHSLIPFFLMVYQLSWVI